MTSFLVWAGVMVAAVLVLFLKLRKSRTVDRNLERASESALNEIGKVAEKKYKQKYGRMPTSTGSWYPEDKKK